MNPTARSTSIIDYIFRELAITYLDKKELAQVNQDDLRGDSVKQDPECTDDEPADPSTITTTAIDPGLFPARQRIQGDVGTGNGQGNGNVAHKIELKRETLAYTAEIETAFQKGFEGDPCPNCKQFKLVRNGMCLVCRNCGETTGCS